MDLRSGHPYWPLKNGILATYPPLVTGSTVDVAIIGGGITGALIAHHLVEEGVETIVLDQRDVAMGSTAASTSLLQYEIDTELHQLVDIVGQQPAVRAYHLGLEAIDGLERLVGTLNDGCGFERKSSLYLASRRSHVERLRREFACREQFGFAVEYLEPREIEARFAFTAPGAILSRGDAQVDAFRLTHSLLRSAERKGLKVHDRTAVTAIHSHPRHFVLDTDRGAAIKARRVVFATGYESQKYLKQNAGALHSTYAAVSEPLTSFPKWAERCLIWETARPYFYLRSTDDNRVIIGGLDVPFSDDRRRDRLISRKSAALARRFRRMFSDSDFEVAFAWAGTFGETNDGLAYIGQSPEWPRAYFALGYGGNGITMSMIAARLITDHHVGRKNPDAAIFRFGR
jgi:glycine/D-amino acid oxidase-like deaminating enzyme